jgi:hypothetical protein
MNKIFFSRYLCWSILTASIGVLQTGGATDSVTEPEKKEENQISDSMCTKEILMTFFPPSIVKSVLVRHQVPADKAAEIAEELSQKDREILRIVEKKASQMEINPFKDLNQRELAIKLSKETIYSVFAQVLKDHQITNEDQIHALLDDIQEAKGKLFINCFRNEDLGQPQAE